MAFVTGAAYAIKWARDLPAVRRSIGISFSASSGMMTSAVWVDGLHRIHSTGRCRTTVSSCLFQATRGARDWTGGIGRKETHQEVVGRISVSPAVDGAAELRRHEHPRAGLPHAELPTDAGARQVRERVLEPVPVAVAAAAQDPRACELRDSRVEARERQGRVPRRLLHLPHLLDLVLDLALLLDLLEGAYLEGRARAAVPRRQPVDERLQPRSRRGRAAAPPGRGRGAGPAVKLL